MQTATNSSSYQTIWNTVAMKMKSVSSFYCTAYSILKDTKPPKIKKFNCLMISIEIRLKNY